MSEEKKLTRRDFLRVSGIVGGAAFTTAIAAGCGSPAAPAPAPTAAPKEAAPTQEKVEAPAVVGKPFKGVTVKMHAISGANYDELYKLIPKWGVVARTGHVHSCVQLS